MDKNPQEILAEIEAAVADLKDRLSALEQQLEQYRNAVAAPAAEGPIDLSAEGLDAFPEIVPVAEPEDLPEDLPGRDNNVLFAHAENGVCHVGPGKYMITYETSQMPAGIE